MNGDNIYINGDTMFTGEVGAEKIKAALLDVEQMFAQTITIPQNGIIQSEQWSTTGSGFRISGSGVIEANEGRFGGSLGRRYFEVGSSNDYQINNDDLGYTGILIVYTGSGSTGSVPFRVRQYQYSAVYYYCFGQLAVPPGITFPDTTKLTLVRIGGDYNCQIQNKASAGQDANINIIYDGTNDNMKLYGLRIL